MLAYTHHPHRNRYEVVEDGEVLGAIEYLRDGSTMTITHTITDEQARGRGVAGQLTSHVLDDARERGLTVVPVCPYAVAFIEKNPQYADLL